MIFLQDLPEKPKFLLTFTVGVGQKAAINEAVQKVSHWNAVGLFTRFLFEIHVAWLPFY
jgi:hypothetical protein